MKKRLMAILSVFLLVALPLISYAATYIGNRNSNKFHIQGCQWERKMNEANRIYFKSKVAAVKAGYVGCKVCKP